MEYSFDVEVALNDAVGNHTYVRKTFATLPDAVNHVQDVLHDENSISVLNTNRYVKHVLTQIGFSQTEIYDITGDVDTNIPTHARMMLLFRTETTWKYCIGGVSPDVIGQVPYLYIKIEKIEQTPCSQVDCITTSVDTMCI